MQRMDGCVSSENAAEDSSAWVFDKEGQRDPDIPMALRFTT